MNKLTVSILMALIFIAPSSRATNLNFENTSGSNILWMDMTRPWTLQLLQRYMLDSNPNPLLISGKPAIAENFKEIYSPKDPAMKNISRNFSFSPLPADSKNKVRILEAPVQGATGPNPFLISNNDFNPGSYLPYFEVPGATPPEIPFGPYPMPLEKDLHWFDEQIAKGAAPEIFLIGGHHVISEGFENSPETRYIFEPGLFNTVVNYAPARAYFDNIKIAVLFGCNTLSDLEPHHDDGTSMDVKEIKELYRSGPAGRKKVIGASSIENSLEFYKNRLAREYGPGSHSYDYTRNASAEKCTLPGPWNCSPANLDRIMPEYGLFDGTRRYNEAINMRRLFRNAYLVLGFSSASPPEEARVQILEVAVEMASKELRLDNANVIQVILAPNTTVQARKTAIVALRKAWEIASFKINRGRPSGSITPAFPDIDQGYVMNQHQTGKPQLNSMYRKLNTKELSE